MNVRRVPALLAALATAAATLTVGAQTAEAKPPPTVPTARTTSATGVSADSATANGTVSARKGTTVTVRFQWGTTSSYGSTTPSQAVRTGRKATPVTTQLTGLAAETTYHFRLVATSTAGTAYGADQSFTTTRTATNPPPPPSSEGTCTDPYFTTSDPNGGITDGGYYVHNNLWNASKYPGTKGTTSVCSYKSWNHVGTASNTSGNGEVKTYPNVHRDYSGRTIASFPRLTSTFAATSPQRGIYNVGYDLWLNGVPNDEVMIWTDNYRQVPAGQRFASGVTLGGHSWDVYATSGNGYIAFVPSGGARLTSGTIDIKAMLTYLVGQGRVASSATVDQICYGVEIVDTGGTPATWNFTDFSLIDS